MIEPANPMREEPIRRNFDASGRGAVDSRAVLLTVARRRNAVSRHAS